MHEKGGLRWYVKRVINFFWGLPFMRRVFICGLCAAAVCLTLSYTVNAGGPDPDNYPLRVHVFRNTAQGRHTRESKTQSDSPDYIDGMGMADLFENGEPRGFEFHFSCMDGLRASGAYGTYPARWKKKDKTLEILKPEPGKPWNLEACDLHTEMRTGLVFFWRNGALAEEAAAVLKTWMVKHQYDPEKDKTDPIILEGEGTTPGGPNDPQIAEPE
jgi:hypothetical protein